MAKNGQSVDTKAPAARQTRRPAAKAATKPAPGAAKAAAATAASAPIKTARPVKVAKPAASPPLSEPATGRTAKEAPASEVREKARKAKLVRDSFTMPEDEYAALGDLKKACLKAGIEVKKSELLRVGVALLRKLDTAEVKRILDQLPTLKAGRPKKGK